MVLSSTAISSKVYFPALTGVRALAAAMVFFFHFNPFKGSTAERSHEAELFLSQGGAGVTIFFVLSGFLITLRYQNSVEFTRNWFRRYLQNRFARIYPVYFFLTVLTFGVWAANQWDGIPIVRDRVVVVILNLTLTRAFFETFTFTGLVTAWSLTVEECFYLSVPFILRSLQRYPYLKLVGYMAALFALGLLLVAAFGGRISFGFMDSNTFMLHATYFGYGMEFMSGIALAIWVQQHGLKQPLRWPILTFVGSAGIVLTLYSAAHLHVAIGGDVVARPAVVVFICLLFYGLISERSQFRQMLETKAFDLFGRASYIFYLLHVSFLTSFLQQHGLGNIAVMLVITIVVSIILYKVIEHPLNLRLRAQTAKASVMLKS